MGASSQTTIARFARSSHYLDREYVHVLLYRKVSEDACLMVSGELLERRAPIVCS